MTVTQPARDVTSDPLGGPPPPPAITSSRRTRKRQSKHDVTSDVTEDDLGIFEDEAECEDLTDSEAADLDPQDADTAENVTQGEDRRDALLGDEGVTTPRDPLVKIEVSISRRSKAKDEESVTSSEVAMTLTPRSERSDETFRPSVFRAKTNTPVSGRSEAGERSTLGVVHTDRQSQGGGSASREAMYQQALSLMSQRCVSSVSTPFHHLHPLTPHHPLPHYPHPSGLPLRDVTPTSRHVTTRVSKSVPSVRRTTLLGGHREPATVYSSRGVVVVTSSKRTVPMPPLKAWRGFTGNVYFEPIKVKAVSQHPLPPGVATGPGNTSPADVTRVKGQTKRPMAGSDPGVPDVTDHDVTTYAHSSPGAPTFRSHIKTHKGAGATRGKPHKMVIVDKGSVFSSNFDNLLNSTDDIKWVVGGKQNHKHPGGSLQVKPEVIKKPKSPTKSRENRKFQYNKEKICRGSVAHRDFALRDKQEAGVTPALSTKQMNSSTTSGGAPTTTGSPTVRPENNKSAENSKNGSCADVPNGKLLPPLDPPLKAGGRSKGPTSGSEGDPRDSLALEQVKPSEHHPHPKDKPYVKYSRDVGRDPNK